MNDPKLDIQVMVRILRLKPPQILHFQILFLIKPPGNETHKVKILIFQSDEQLMLVMQFSDPLVIREDLFHKLVFWQEFQIFLVPEPHVTKFVCKKEDIFVEELIDDVYPLALFSVFEEFF